MISQHDREARQYWNRLWNRFLKFHGMIAPSAKLIQLMIPHVPRSGILLDLGCGEGRNSIYLSRIGYRVIGLDLSSKALKVLMANLFEEEVRGTGITGDARNLPFKSESVDGVLAHHLFDHLDQSAFQQAQAEVLRILKPGGVLLLSMDSFTAAAQDKLVVRRDDGSILFTHGPKKGMLIRPFHPEEIAQMETRGWELLKQDLTPRSSIIALLRKAMTQSS